MAADGQLQPFASVRYQARYDGGVSVAEG